MARCYAVTIACNMTLCSFILADGKVMLLNKWWSHKIQFGATLLFRGRRLASLHVTKILYTVLVFSSSIFNVGTTMN